MLKTLGKIAGMNVGKNKDHVNGVALWICAVLKKLIGRTIQMDVMELLGDGQHINVPGMNMKVSWLYWF